MTSSNLPLDVVDAICHFLDTSELLAFALVNSRLRPFAQRCLFRRVSLHAPVKAVLCLRTLAASPTLALYVRSFSMRLGASAPVLRPFVQALAAALSHMSNVTALDLLLPHATSSALKSAVAVDQAFPRLTRLVCNFSLDASVAAFLQRTPVMTDLHLGDYGSSPKACSLPSSALPRLSLFMGSCEAAAVLAPGRPLESVHLHSGDLTDDVLVALSQSTGPITVFGALTNYLSPSLLVSLASNLPRLHHLRIMTMYHSADHQHDEVFYSQVVRILGTLSELSTAELAGIHWASWQKHSMGIESGWNSKPAVDTDDNAAALIDEPLLDGFASY